MTHRDFKNVEDGKLAAVAIVAVEDGTAIIVKNKKVMIPKGFMFLMRGDVFHAGAEYKKDNLRLYFNHIIIFTCFIFRRNCFSFGVCDFFTF